MSNSNSNKPKVKFSEKLKSFGRKAKMSAKANPKLFGTIAAAIIIASGGSAATASGIIEAATMLDVIGQSMNAVTGAE